jgi:glycosyltransferase involved in cell wall biosynthesis
MVRVLHVLEALTGGTSRHVADIVANARASEHVVVVPPERVGDVTDHRAVEQIKDARGTVHVIDMRRMPVHPANATALAAVLRLVNTERIDVLHGHSSIGGVLARVAARRHRRPVVWTPNGVMTSRPVVAIERKLARWTDAIVAVSPSEAELLGRLRIARAEQLLMIPNAIDITPAADGTDLRALTGIPADAKIVGSIARLVPQKAPLDYVEVCRRVSESRPDVHFVLIGDGKLAGEVDAAVARWDRAGRFHRLRALPNAARVLGQMDVFVLTSRYEGAPYAALEAMREGAPMVLTRVVGSADLVSDGETGLLCEGGDLAGMAKLIQDILDNEKKSTLLTKRARELLVTSYDVRGFGRAHDDLYERLGRHRDLRGAGTPLSGEPPE